MKRKRQDPAEERRRERVEINLADEDEGGRGPIQAARRGCALPFGIWLLAVAAAIAAHALSGAV